MKVIKLDKIKKGKTLVIIKPDGIQRSLIGTIIDRFERIGLKLIAMKFFIPSKNMIEKHYTVDPEWLRKVGEKTIEGYKSKNLIPPTEDPIKSGMVTLERLSKYMSSGPVMVMIWQGAHSVGIVRKLIGGTEPLMSDVGTIRGDLVIDSYQIAGIENRAIRNIVHASGTSEEAEQEIKVWFNPDEILNYRLVQEEILYDVNLDGILE